MNSPLWQDSLYPIAPKHVQQKMEQRKLTQQEYLTELFKQQYFSLNDIPADSIESLSYYINTFYNLLKTRSKTLRKSQIDSLEAIIAHLRKGKFKGLIKLPTGTGKTRLFTEVIGAINMPSVVLIPRTSLKGQTLEGFVDLDVIDNKRIFVIGYKENKEKGAVLELKAALDSIEKNHISNPIILITYQSLLSVKRTDPELFDRFRKIVQCIIRDEAHRSIGDETADALEELKRFDEGFDEGEKKLELLLTATPKLLGKDIRNNYETIISIRTQEVIEQGDLIMPRRKAVGKAYVTTDTEDITEEFLKENSLKFVDEYGTPIYEKVIDAYEEEKKRQPNNYLPFVAVCSTIQQAEFIRGKMEERECEAVRVTSGNKEFDKGVHEDDAKVMLLQNTTDGVTTVAKVAEGWDVKTLRVVLHFCPIRSEAKYIQVTGRIMRTLAEDEINHEVGMIAKDSQNTIIIEPDVWYVGSVKFEEEGEAVSYDLSGGFAGQPPMSISSKVSGLGHFINSGEFDSGFLEKHYGSLVEYDEFKDLIEVDVNGRVVLDEIEYQWVSEANVSSEWYAGVTPWKINDHVRSQTEERKKLYVRKAKAKGFPVMVVEVHALNELLKKNLETPFLEDLETGRIVIEGVIHQWVGHNMVANQLWGVQGFTAIAKIKKQDAAWHTKNVKKVRSKKGDLKVVELKALEDLLRPEGELPEMKSGGRVFIDAIEYQWVGVTTPAEQLRGITGATANNRVERHSEERKKMYVKRAKTTSGSVNVVNFGELEKILKHLGSIPVVNENGRVFIEGMEYQWVGEKTPSDQLWGMNGSQAKSRVNAKEEERKTIYIKDARSSKKGEIVVVEVQELEKLIKEEAELPRVGKNGRIMIEGIEYQWVGTGTPEQQLRGMKAFTAYNKMQEQSVEWKKNHTKMAIANRKPAVVVEVQELEKLIKEEAELPRVNENGRVFIEGMEYQWVGPTTPSEQLWGMSGYAAKPRVDEQSDERKKMYVKKAKSNGTSVTVLEVKALETLIRVDAELTKLGEDGKVIIDGVEYQWVGVNTPKNQLDGLEGAVVKRKIDEYIAQGKSMDMKKAKVKTGTVEVYKSHQIIALIQEYKKFPGVDENMKVVLVDKENSKEVIYQWVGSHTPPNYLWGMSGAMVKKRVNNQSKAWKDKYVKIGLLNRKEVDIIEIHALEALIRKAAELPKVDENGRVMIDDAVYQWVGHETPLEQLWGMSGRSIQRKIDKQSVERKQINVKKAQKGGRPMLVVNLEELMKIKDL